MLHWRRLVVTSALVAGCGSETDPGELANGVINLQAMLSAEVAGAAGTLWVIQTPDGTDVDRHVADFETDADGRVRLEIGVNRGTLLVETFGGVTEELLSGEQVQLSDATRLAAVFYLRAGQEVDVYVTPLSTMAEALGDARLARGDKEESYREAHERALELVGEHFGQIADPVGTRPIDATLPGDGGEGGERVRYGVVLAALSRLALDIAEESGVGAAELGTAELVAALAADLGSGEALFDGVSAEGPIAIGDCPRVDPAVCPECTTICDIGARTARNDLAAAVETFIGSTANATGLDSQDVSGLTTAIARSTEPELFGDAPAAVDPPELTVSSQGFLEVGGVWWTKESGPRVAGEASSATSEYVRVVVRVGEVEVEATRPLAEIFPTYWEAELPAGALAPAPAGNAVRVIATDSVGNRTTVEREVRVDEEPASVTFVGTDLKDETGDTVSFATIPPTHTHAGNTNSVGSAGCTTIHKHVSIYDDDSNPLVFTFRVTDTGVGISESSVRYRVRRQGAAGWLNDWMVATDVGPVSGGREYQVRLRRAEMPALGTDDGTRFEIVARGADRLGQSEEKAACWTNNLLPPPLRTLNVATGTSGDDPTVIQNAKLGARQLNANNVAEIINGAPVSGGAGVMLFEVENRHDVPVYFQVGWQQPSVSGSKTWRQRYQVTSTQSANDYCGFNPCDTSLPYTNQNHGNVPITSVPNLIAGTRVWEVTGGGTPTSVSQCAGCPANRYRIAARVSASTPRRYRVMLVTTNLRAIQPAPGAAGSTVWQEFPLAWDLAFWQLTGRPLPIVTKCSNQVSSTNGEGFTVYYCTQRSTYEAWGALQQAKLDIDEITATVSTSLTSSGPASGLDSLTQPSAPPYPWETTKNPFPN